MFRFTRGAEHAVLYIGRRLFFLVDRYEGWYAAAYWRGQRVLHIGR